MKKITLLLILMIASLGYSQTDVIESFDGATQPGLQPDNGECTAIGMNISTAQQTTGANSLEIIAQAAGNGWQGARLTLQDGGMDLTTNKLVKVDVYYLNATSDVAILAKLTDSPGGDAASAKNHTGSGWETLTFDFTEGADGTGTATGVYSDIRFYPLWSQSGGYAGQGGTPCVSDAPITIFIDNIVGTTPPVPTCTDGIQNGDETGIDCGGSCPNVCETCTDGIMNNGETGVDCGGPNCSACVTPPTVAAPTPPNRSPGDVVSIYSDAYTDIGANLDAGWCGAPAISEVMIAGNATQKWNGFPCEGIDFSGNRQDLSSFTRFHVDLYTDVTDLVGKVFKLKLVDFNGGGAEASALEINFTDGTMPGVTVTGNWISLDIDITTLGAVVAGSLTRGDIAQIGVTSNLSSAWWDNMYIYKGVPLSTDDFAKTSFKAYPNPTQDSWTVSTENINMSSIQVFDVLGKNVLSLSPNNSDAKIDGSSLKSGLYFAKIETETGISTIKLVRK